MRTFILFSWLLIFVLFTRHGNAQPRTKTSLNGAWTFALDPLKIGEEREWFAKEAMFTRFDKVTVPHSFSVDPRYSNYTGTAWYFKKFSRPETPEASRCFLKFDAVFYKAKIWLNGRMVGEHEGGYTPFEIEVTGALNAENTLCVSVSNSWDTTTIPGAKTNVNIDTQNSGQLFPWINYGGLTRPVQIISRPTLYADRLKIVANPVLINGTAQVKINALVHNGGTQLLKITPAAFISFNGAPTAVRFKTATIDLAPGAEKGIELQGSVLAKDVKLWNQDAPNLYSLQLVTGTDTLRSKFGIRSFTVSGTKLLLNGEAVRMGGCNRPLDFPGFGSMDPDSILNIDLNLVKSGGMELSRISHYPVSEQLLDWADEHGLLIIPEAGNWQMTPKQMSDTMMRRKFQSQLTEMVTRDWNHPSVVAWSMGNEFQSQTQQGKDWVKDMKHFTKTLDSSRLITFASMIVKQDYIKQPEDEASQFVDFISVNIYSNHLKALQHIHEVYPDKPVYVSEFGLRTDGVKSEDERVAHLQKAMADFRQCEFLVGASVWTFNDYQSRFPGSNPNGYRPWGLVSPERNIRGMYTAWQEEFSPATMTLVEQKENEVVLKITARADFPSYILRGYTLLSGTTIVKLNQLQPGESQQVTIKTGNDKSVSLIKPGGFKIFTKAFK